MAISTTVQVTLPAMGESVTEGTVLEWHKAEGEHVEADETLVEVSTDKVDAEVPAPVSGTVVKVHFAEGDTVQVGALLARDPARRRRRPDRGRLQRRGCGRLGVGDRDADRACRRRADRSDAGRRDHRHRHASGRRVRHRGHAARVARRGRRGGRATATRSSRSRPTRSTSSCPRPATGVITELLVAEGETVTVGQVIARMQATTRRLDGDGAARTAPRRPRPRRAAPAPAADARRRQAPRRSPRASRPPRASTSAPSRAPARAAASRRPTCSPPRTGARPGAGRRRRGQADPRRRGDARQVHGREPLDPDGDLVPHDHRHGDGRRAASSSRRPARRSRSRT